jgi:hypothetical protein
LLEEVIHASFSVLIFAYFIPWHLTSFILRTTEDEKQEVYIEPLYKAYFIIYDIVEGKWIVKRKFWLAPLRNKVVRKKKFPHFWNGHRAPFSPWAGKRSG